MDQKDLEKLDLLAKDKVNGKGGGSDFVGLKGQPILVEEWTTPLSSTSDTLPIKPGNMGFIHGFISAFSMIVVSEIGDKTFFIAAVMSMKHSRVVVFIGAISALTIMTLLSVFFGWFASGIPREYTQYISAFLLTIFGLKMLRDGYKMKKEDAQEELDEVQRDLRRREEELEREALCSDMEKGTARSPSINWYTIARVMLQAFTLTFVAEWGDRSQLTTVLLSATENLYGVILGTILGHSVCTGIAVVGGRLIAQRISVKTVTILGGIVFLVFAATAFFYQS